MLLFPILCCLYCVVLFSVFFFSSRRRHTRCALVTGVQTCALPISAQYGGTLGRNAPCASMPIEYQPYEEMLRDACRRAAGRGGQIGRASCRERVCQYV